VLDLSNHGLGIGGAAALAAALEDNDTLVEIRLPGNSMGNHGGIAVARAFASNTSARTLDLSRFAAPTLAHPLASRASPILSCVAKHHTSVKSLSSVSAAVILLLHALTHACMNAHCPARSNGMTKMCLRAIAELLMNNRTLSSLNLSGNLFGDCDGIAIADAISVNRSVTSLNLSRCGLESKAGAALGE
jgi:Ran GTPase-activating protein (RanGAP) involved in mRNA processing and transport